jgi:dTDP-4-dehydrorhamnose reductase
MVRKKVLILGGSSKVGTHLIDAMKNEDILYTYNTNIIPGGAKFDSTSMNVDDFFDLNSIKSVVILLGNANPDSCFVDPLASEQINVLSIKRIIDSLANHPIKVIYASSEVVYEGKKRNNIETDNVNPALLYGKQKVKIEQYLEEHIENYLILRFGKIYGSEVGDGTMFTSWYESIKEGVVEMICADDQYFSPIHYDDVIKVVRYVLHSKTKGIYNLGGPISASRLEFLQMFLDEYGDHNVNVTSCSIDSFKVQEKRPRDVSMDSRRIIYETQFTFKHPIEACREIIEKSISNG